MTNLPNKRIAGMQPIKKPSHRAQTAQTVVGKQDHEALRADLAEHDRLLLPMLDLIQNTRISVDELMYNVGRVLVEQLLMMVVSAREVAGGKHVGVPVAMCAGTARSLIES